MNRLASLAVAVALFLGTRPEAARADLTVDPPHTSAAFSVKHLTLTTVTGSIAVKEAKIAVAPDDALTSAEATLDLTTIDTKVDARDQDLKSDHFFDVAKYPTMTFKSTKITGTKDAMTVVGDLTFHGITKSVTLAAKFEGSVNDRKGTHLGYSATGTLDRSQWNLGPNYPVVVVGNDVTITIELEAVQT